jgi:hypothetical protein
MIIMEGDDAEAADAARKKSAAMQDASRAQASGFSRR